MAIVENAEVARTLKPINTSRIVRVPSTQTIVVGFNAARKPTDDLRVRRALAHLFDLWAFKRAMFGMVDILPTPIPRRVLGSTAKYWDYKPDLEAARRLFAEAGYSGGYNRLTIVASSIPWHSAVAQVVKDFFSRATPAEVRIIDVANFFESLEKGDWHIQVSALTRTDPAEYALMFLPGSRLNYGRYTHPALPEIIARGRRALDPRERATHYEEMQKIVAEQVFGIYPGTNLTSLVLDRQLEGIVPHPYPGVATYWQARFKP